MVVGAVNLIMVVAIISASKWAVTFAFWQVTFASSVTVASNLPVVLISISPVPWMESLLLPRSYLNSRPPSKLHPDDIGITTCRGIALIINGATDHPSFASFIHDAPHMLINIEGKLNLIIQGGWCGAVKGAETIPSSSNFTLARPLLAITSDIIPNFSMMVN
jgi:hypothetical protein